MLVEDEYYYLIAMLTPARTNDFLTWARNAKAFERVAESIRSEVSEKDPATLARREQERRRREADAELTKPEWELSPEKLAERKRKEKARAKKTRQPINSEESEPPAEESAP